ncbi:hypothetical protein [Planotetraspora sp. GP83]|uniref:hypothetical protein n=1 Tax=Planotetraspora sp. GP83 TaxID=3156264 RepID=UPI003518AA26
MTKSVTRVTVYRNLDRRGDRYMPGDRLAAVHTGTLPGDLWDMFASSTAEHLRWVFGPDGAVPADMTDAERVHRRTYQAAGLPPFVSGDVLLLNRWAFTWDAYGLSVTLRPADLTITRTLPDPEATMTQPIPHGVVVLPDTEWGQVLFALSLVTSSYAAACEACGQCTAPVYTCPSHRRDRASAARYAAITDLMSAQLHPPGRPDRTPTGPAGTPTADRPTPPPAAAYPAGTGTPRRAPAELIGLWQYRQEPIAYHLDDGRVLCAPGCLTHTRAQVIADAGSELGEVHPWTVDLYHGDKDLTCSACGRVLVQAPISTEEPEEGTDCD